jgi:hypothetical protein
LLLPPHFDVVRRDQRDDAGQRQTRQSAVFKIGRVDLGTLQMIADIDPIVANLIVLFLFGLIMLFARYAKL